MHLDNNKLKQTIFIVALFALGGFLFWLLSGFLSALLGALVFYILLRKPLFYLTEKRNWNAQLATALLMLVSFLVLVLPIFLVSLMLSGKVSFLINHYADILRIAQEWSAKAKDYLGIDLLTGDTVNKLTSLAAGAIPKILSAAVNALVDIFVLYFLLFFMLANSHTLEKEAQKYLPFDESNNGLLLRELQKQTVANSIGIVVLAVLQAIIAGIGYIMFGVSEPGFWAVITGIASVVPVVGVGAIWVPLCVFLYVSGHHWQSLALVGYCGIIMAFVENVFRTLVIKRLGDIHPLITFFGVIMGLDIFGFVGVIYGPLLISYFILLLRIYRHEYLGVPHKKLERG